MTISALVFSLVLLCTIVLVILSVRMVGKTNETGPSAASRFLLVALRLAIGWHFFIEAAEKLHDPTWSSEGYLRESTGPLAPMFRTMGGDRLIEQLTLNEDGSLSSELDARWQAYLDEFANFYRLNADQQLRAQGILDQAKATAKAWLSSRKRKVRLLTVPDDLPPLWADLVMADRLKTYQQIKDEVRLIEEDDLGRYGVEAEEKWKSARSRAAKWRGTLQRDFALLEKELKRNLRTLLLEIAKQDLPVDAASKISGGKAVNYQVKLEDALTAATKKREKIRAAAPPDVAWEMVDAHQHKFDEEDLYIYQGLFSEVRQAEYLDKLDEQTRRIVQYAIDKKKAPDTSYDLIPYGVSKPMSAYALVDWGDFAVKWGLLIVGLFLILGLLTRTSCVIGALYLLMFYLAMPALPGWPASPRAEGHYLYINKNIIEMIALLALATFRTGRWAGLDAIIGTLRRDKRDQSPDDRLSEPEA